MHEMDNFKRKLNIKNCFWRCNSTICFYTVHWSSVLILSLWRWQFSHTCNVDSQSNTLNFQGSVIREGQAVSQLRVLPAITANSLPPTICGKPKQSRQAFSLYLGRLRENCMHEIFIDSKCLLLVVPPCTELKYWLSNNEHTNRVNKVSFANYWSHHFVFAVATRFSNTGKAEYQLRHICLSVRPHATRKLPLDGFSWSLIIWVFFKNVSKKFKFL